MKNLAKKITALSLALITLLSLFSCGSGNKKLSAFGLEFTLPESMGKLVSDGYAAYQNKEDGTKVYVYSYSNADMEEMLPDSVSIKPFAEYYIHKNGIEPSSSEYDEKSDTYTLKYVELVDGKERFSHDYFLKSDSVYYHFRMTCDVELKGEYEKKFEKWKKSVKVSENLIYYSESGLNFALPDYMKKISVPPEYADLCFSNSGDGTQFFIYYYAREALLTDLVLDMDCTVKDYAEWFVNVNDYVGVVQEYDEENQKLVQKYVYEPENTFYCDFILRNEYILIHTTMSCDNKYRDVYEPIFERWMKEISLITE